jgi:hypothetical protein
MLEHFILAIIIQSSECKALLIEVRTPYGEMCLTKEQVSRLGAKK